MPTEHDRVLGSCCLNQKEHLFTASHWGSSGLSGCCSKSTAVTPYMLRGDCGRTHKGTHVAGAHMHRAVQGVFWVW